MAEVSLLRKHHLSNSVAGDLSQAMPKVRFLGLLLVNMLPLHLPEAQGR